MMATMKSSSRSLSVEPSKEENILNKMIKAAGLGLLVLSSSMFANAAEAAQKIAYVNTAQVFQALPQREVVLQKMQKDFKSKADELKSIQDAVKKVATKKGYDMVIDISSLQYGKPEYNISEDVIKALK